MYAVDYYIKICMHSIIFISFREMFYDTKKVDKILLCKYCEGRLDVPKNLPCGKAICTFCETSIQILENNKFDCLICKKKHEMPLDGLLIII